MTPLLQELYQNWLNVVGTEECPYLPGVPATDQAIEYGLKQEWIQGMETALGPVQECYCDDTMCNDCLDRELDKLNAAHEEVRKGLPLHKRLVFDLVSWWKMAPYKYADAYNWCHEPPMAHWYSNVLAYKLGQIKDRLTMCWYRCSWRQKDPF